MSLKPEIKVYVPEPFWMPSGVILHQFQYWEDILYLFWGISDLHSNLKFKLPDVAFSL